MPSTTKKKPATKELLRNKKAFHDFRILERLEAGISLRGTEVKSCRARNISFADSFVRFTNGEAILVNLHISPYKMASGVEMDPLRERRLLMHRREIDRLQARIEQKGMTLVLLSIYFKRRIAKVELGLGQGRKKYDKRQAIAKADADRRMKQATHKDQD